MQHVKNRRRGATLAELCVVIAVAAIVAVMVVSFSTMASQRVRVTEYKAEVLTEIAMVESVTEQWIHRCLGEGKTPNAIETFAPRIEGDKLIFDESLSVPVNVIDQLHLTVETSNDDALYTVTLIYSDANGKATPYTFFVNPRIGEVYQKEGV